MKSNFNKDAYVPPLVSMAAISIFDTILGGSVNDYNYQDIWNNNASGNTSDYIIEDL